jgi:hypothetical protein
MERGGMALAKDRPLIAGRSESIMGNRDTRGREKKKPKKKEANQPSRPARPTTEYKPVSVPQPHPTGGGTS